MLQILRSNKKIANILTTSNTSDTLDVTDHLNSFQVLDTLDDCYKREYNTNKDEFGVIDKKVKTSFERLTVAPIQICIQKSHCH